MIGVSRPSQPVRSSQGGGGGSTGGAVVPWVGVCSMLHVEHQPAGALCGSGGGDTGPYRARTRTSFLLASCHVLCNAARFLLGSPVCCSCFKHQRLMRGFQSPSHRITGFIGLASSCQRFESARSETRSLASKGSTCETLYASLLSSSFRPHLHSSMRPCMRRSWCTSSISSP